MNKKIPLNRPFIIAEIGSNWRNINDCFYSIRQAKLCGADAAKFQLYTAKALYGLDCLDEMKGSLPFGWLTHLKEECDRVGIEFMCSAFSPELAERVNPFVNYHKVASAECNHIRLLERLRSFEKPVILSTGAHGVDDMRMALQKLQGSDELGFLPCDVVVMYCVASYPANEIDLRAIPELQKELRLPVGYSDHSTDVLTIPKRAIELGAVVLEKHVTFINADTPDSPHSLTGDQFRKMVLNIRGDYPVTIGPKPSERDMVLKHTRRIIATKDIEPGDTIREGLNVGIYRSLDNDTHAYHPFLINGINGQIAGNPIKAGNGVGPGDLAPLATIDPWAFEEATLPVGSAEIPK